LGPTCRLVARSPSSSRMSRTGGLLGSAWPYAAAADAGDGSGEVAAEPCNITTQHSDTSAHAYNKYKDRRTGQYIAASQHENVHEPTT
jgi:hypothetical protein